MLNACGGGGGGDASTQTNSAGQQSASGYNGPLSGSVYDYGGEITTSKIDLASGKTLAKYNFEFALPTSDGNMFGIKQDNLPTFPSAAMIFFNPTDQSVINKFTYNGKVLDFPRVSPNGQYIAFTGRPSTGFADQGAKGLYVYSKLGKEIKYATNASGHAWTPDGGLLTIANNQILRAEPPSFTATRIIKKIESGQVGDVINISDGGGKIAVNVNGSGWIMDGDGSNFRQLVKSSSRPGITGSSTPILSPDGNWALILSVFDIGNGRYADGCFQTYAVPTNRSDKVFDVALNTADPDVIRVKKIGYSDLCAAEATPWF